MSRSAGRWDEAVLHCADDVDRFVADYFGEAHRRTVLIAGAGFDPRSPLVATTLSEQLTGSLHGVLINETRQVSDDALAARAAENREQILGAVQSSEQIDVDVFGENGSVVGGRRIAQALNDLIFEDATDIVVDLSALSVGVSFPTVKFLLEKSDAGQLKADVHVFVSHDPELDSLIISTPTDGATPVHGFDGGLQLTRGTEDPSARLWLPQLATGRAPTNPSQGQPR